MSSHFFSPQTKAPAVRFLKPSPLALHIVLLLLTCILFSLKLPSLGSLIFPLQKYIYKVEVTGPEIAEATGQSLAARKYK